MTREIKFRGKSLDKSKWLYGSLLSWKNGCTDMLIEDDTCEMFDEEPVIPDTVGQYTGLKDKNGREIYEGDILRYCDDMLMVVEFAHGMFCYKYLNNCIGLGQNNHFNFWKYDKDDEFEIVGNIHDNPELLEGAKDEKDLKNRINAFRCGKTDL